MTVYKINNVFTDTELELLEASLNGQSEDGGHHLGRVQLLMNTPPEIIEKLKSLVKEITKEEHITMYGGMCVEYGSEYGIPDLPPHFDGDTSDLIIDFQLSSNTSWDLGVNTDLYRLEDNTAIAFNPNTNIHWRPIKEFKDGEFVRLMFFRCRLYEEQRDYSDRILSQDHPIFDEIRLLRTTLAANNK